MAGYYALALSPLMVWMHPDQRIGSPSISGCFTARRSPSIVFAIFAGALSVASADAGGLSPQDSNLLTPIVGDSPTLAPFQHVRFCLRYPSDCKSNPTEDGRIE